MSHFSDSQFMDTISSSLANLPLVLELYSIPFNSTRMQITTHWRGTSNISLGRERKRNGTPGTGCFWFVLWRVVMVGLESVPSDEDAKTFAGLTEMMSTQKKKFNNYKLNIRALRGPSTVLHTRHYILRYRRRSKGQRVIQWQFKTCMETSVWEICRT